MLSGMWLSLVERFVRDEEVACSNHVIPMLEKERNPQSFQGVSLFLHYVIFNSRAIGTERKGCRNMNQIKKATEADAQEILKLYQTMLYGPADWNEGYPSHETIAFDLSRGALFVMKNVQGEILAAISIDEDEAVDRLTCWNPALQPSAELARLCVRKDAQGKGIAKQMMRFVFGILREEGKKSVHILVKTGHEVALSAYRTLGFREVGTCHLFDKDFICMEIIL